MSKLPCTLFYTSKLFRCMPILTSEKRIIFSSFVVYTLPLLPKIACKLVMGTLHPGEKPDHFATQTREMVLEPDPNSTFATRKPINTCG